MNPPRTHSIRTGALLAGIGGLLLTGSAAVVDTVLARLAEPVPNASVVAAGALQPGQNAAVPGRPATPFN